MIEGSQTIIVHNDKILIAKRSDFKKLAPNRWNFIGGKIEDNDLDPFQGALREIQEEVGLSVKLTDLVKISTKVVSWDNQEPFLCHTFVAFIEDIGSLQLNNEHSEYKWIDINSFEKFNVIGYSIEEVNSQVINIARSLYKS